MDALLPILLPIPLLIPVLALAAELVYVGFAVAVTLLLTFQPRLMRRFTAGEEAVRRVDKTQREAAADARARAEETTKDFEALTGTVRPKLGEMEGRLEDLGGRIEALAAQVAGVARVEAGLGEARGRLDQAEGLAWHRGSRRARRACRPGPCPVVGAGSGRESALASRRRAGCALRSLTARAPLVRSTPCARSSSRRAAERVRRSSFARSGDPARPVWSGRSGLCEKSSGIPVITRRSRRPPRRGGAGG